MIPSKMKSKADECSDYHISNSFGEEFLVASDFRRRHWMLRDYYLL